MGSTVLVNELDGRGRSLTSTLVARIEDSIGSFSFEIDHQIVATGYYFSELTGQISRGMLTLRALYEVDGAARQRAHVNVLTHLVHDRVLALVADGTRTWSDAIEQAEDELTAAFIDALPVPDVDAFSELSLYDMATPSSNDLGNAYLLALSTGFYKYADTKAQAFGTATDAELTLVLNQISADLATDGDLDSPSFIPAFVTAIRSLSPTAVAANLRSRSLVDYPRGLDVPDISRFLGLCAGNFACAWTAGAPMQSGRRSHAAAAHGGRIYVFGGTGSGDTLGSVQEYDPLANAWTPRAPMPQAGFAEAHTIGDYIYVLTSYGNSGFQNGLYRYDPRADSWSVRAPRPSYRYGFASAEVGGKIYVIGGEGQADDGPSGSGSPWELKRHVEIYDPVTDAWSVGAPLPTATTEGRACAVGGTIYLLGGRTAAAHAETAILTYDTLAATWSAKAPMPEGRAEFACVSVGGIVYLLGGRQSAGWQLADAVGRYDPFVDTWAAPTRLPTPRTRLTAVALGERIFIFGGENTTYQPTAVEIYDTTFEGP